MTADQADSALDTTLTQYNSLVYGTYGAVKKSGNGLDSVYNDFVTDVNNIKAAIAGTNNGNVAIPPIGKNGSGGFAGVPGFSLSFAAPVTPSDPSGLLSAAKTGLAPLVTAGENALASVTGPPTITTGSGATATTSVNYVFWGALVILALLLLRAIR